MRYGGNGDTWQMSWAADDRQYATAVEGAGFAAHPTAYYNSRMVAITGGPSAAQFRNLPDYPMVGLPSHGPREPRYLNYGTLALNGRLYQFLSTYNYPWPDVRETHDPLDLVRFVGVKLIYSPDNGRTWRNQNGSTPVVWQPWGDRSGENMLFWEEDQEAFSMCTVLQMGRNYEHNRDGYVYVYAPNGNTEGTMNELVMFRVAKVKILDRRAYEYFAGRSAAGEVRWSADIQARAVVHTFPPGWVNTDAHPYAWLPSVVYCAPLGVYLMANWATGLSPKGNWFSKPSYLGFWTASDPWGPWEQIHEETAWMPGGDSNARAFQGQIAPKWIAPDGKSFWLVWSDIQVKDQEALKRFAEEYQRIVAANAISEAEVPQFVALMRKALPYFSFNVQRVDLTV